MKRPERKLPKEKLVQRRGPDLEATGQEVPGINSKMRVRELSGSLHGSGMLRMGIPVVTVVFLHECRMRAKVPHFISCASAKLERAKQDEAKSIGSTRTTHKTCA